MSRRIKLNDLKPDSRNHNKHTPQGMALLEKSVEQVGIIESITVSNDDQIISGNARHEVIGRKFDAEPIVVETDGTRPVILKRTDIQSNTPEFYKASILANTTAKKNIDIDLEVVEELAEEYELDAEELGVDLLEDIEHSENLKELNSMIACALTDEEAEIWLKTKERLNKHKDKNAIFELIKLYYNENSID